MADLDVEKLNNRLKYKIEKANLLSTEKILLMSSEDYFKIGNFTVDEIATLKDLAASQRHIRFYPVSTIEDRVSNNWKTISLECKEIDELLGGGLPTRGITELSGVSGAGKTQFCLQYSLTVQYSAEHGGLGKGAVYICTEDRFPSKRFHQLQNYFPRNTNIKKVSNNFGDNVYIMHIDTVEALRACLFFKLPGMIKTTPIGLLVIDSIAAVFRSDYTISQSVSRAKDLREIGVQLHHFVNKFGIAVLVVNQVTEAIGSGRTIPALGLAWANLVTTKIQLGILHDRKRTFNLLSAPHMPPGSVLYKIEASGIKTS